MSESHESHQPAMPHPDVARGQFLRIEKFAVQAPRGKSGGNTIRTVAHEAVRTEGFCPHVAKPVAPTLLYGVGPLEAAELAESWARQQTAVVLHKPSQTLMTRKFRADKPCAVVGVISVPPEWALGPRWTDFCKKSMNWLKEKYSKSRLRCVLEHRDERCLHLHFWVVPLADESFSSIHPGENAIDEVGRKAARVVREAAYKKAMAKLLDEFHQAVGRHFGLERETVGGKRRSRSDWMRLRYLEEQRERDIVKRIDAAVDAAIHQLLMDQRSGHALEKVITAQPDRAGGIDRVIATPFPAISSPIAIEHAEPVHIPALVHKSAGLEILASQQRHIEGRVREESPLTASSRASKLVADFGVQPIATVWTRPRER